MNGIYSAIQRDDTTGGDGWRLYGARLGDWLDDATPKSVSAIFGGGKLGGVLERKESRIGELVFVGSRACDQVGNDVPVTAADD